MGLKKMTNTEIYEVRELNKYSLETYHRDKNNVLDYPLNALIEDLKSKLENNYKEHEMWINMSHNDPEKYENLSEIAERHGLSLESQQHDYIRDAIYIEEELYVLFEMKIIYAFKHLEINIKRLLSAAYGISTKEFYKWDFLIKFLSSKNIALSEFEGYNEILQLKQVNNHFKHNYDFNGESFKHIYEFNGKKELSYQDVEIFYQRVKPFPEKFLSAVAFAVFDDLYMYNEEKIDNMTQNLAMQMDKTTAEQFARVLLEKYD